MSSSGRVREGGGPSPLRISRIDHIGIIVDNLVEAAAFVRGMFGLSEESRIERSDLRAVFFSCQGVGIEFIEVIDPAQRAIRLGGERARIEHVAVVVDDLDQALDNLRRHGVQTTDPRWSQGRRTCWSLPATTDGVVYQLVEE
jgi:catechol 2,3-dioxygenase-like lactoylglutathione lyase family enzyme